MLISDVITYLETISPRSMQEGYDNSGLITGNALNTLTNALISLDCTEEIIDEAVSKNCNMVISHHPILFKGIKSLTGKNYVERTIIKAIKNDIAIYAIHTNLDNYKLGVNYKIGQILGMENAEVLSPVVNKMVKLAVFAPINETETIKNAMFSSGAGNIGNYSECSFTSNGKGTFKASAGANPYVGDIDSRHTEEEVKIEVIVSEHILNHVVQAMLKAHPYEEVAYDCIPLLNLNKDEGAGMIGDLSDPMDEMGFLQLLKTKFNTGFIRHTALRNKKIKRVAWCGGAGSFLTQVAKNKGADIFITGDIKYHEFFDTENQLVLADIGHFESEQYTIELLGELLQKKIPTFAPCLTDVNTNPVKYF